MIIKLKKYGTNDTKFVYEKENSWYIFRYDYRTRNNSKKTGKIPR